MLIVAYTAEWIQNFEDIKAELMNALIGLNYTIEHVGSTAVPGLDAKPIIDLDIIHESEAEFEEIKNRLSTLGYYHNGNQGIEKREAFKRNGLISNEILDRVTHHLYVCPSDSKALERHLLFRDCLRKNKAALLEYQRMKYEIAAKVNQDKTAYAELKELTVNDFIDALIAKEKN